MEKKNCYGICFFLLLLIFLASQEVMMVAEARTPKPRLCQSLSHKFKGPCVSDGNCAQVCRNENFTGGDCRGARRRCFCTKAC